MSDTREVVRFFQGWVEMLEKNSKGKVNTEKIVENMQKLSKIKFTNTAEEGSFLTFLSRTIWMVMKGENIFLFTHQTVRSEETSRGYLPINSKTKFERKKKEEKKFGDAYVFEIFAEKDSNSRTEKFKMSKKADFEVLRGYISAISQGRIPDDLDVPSSTKDEMKTKFEYHIKMKSGQFGDYLEPVNRRKQRRMSDPTFLGSESFPTPGSVDSTRRHTLATLNTMPSNDISTKSWFFPNTNRDKAIEMFNKVGCQHGNTLLRGNSSRTTDDRYAITYCSSQGYNKELVFTHFQVIKTEGGYKIEVDECNEVIQNLEDVMDVFIKINGADKTYPMKTNDLVELGMEAGSDEENYTRRIPPKKTVFPVPEEPPPDYDEENVGGDSIAVMGQSPLSGADVVKNVSDSNAPDTQAPSQQSPFSQVMSEIKTLQIGDDGIPSFPAPPPPPPPPPAVPLPP